MPMTRSRRSFVRPGLAVLLLTGVACGDGPLTPTNAAGSYALTQIDGQRLPAAVFDDVIRDPSGATEDFHLRIVAMTGLLTLTAAGRYEHTVDLTPEIDGVPQNVARWRDHGQFVVRGDTLDFTSEAIQPVSFAAAFKAGASWSSRTSPARAERSATRIRVSDVASV